MSKLRGCSKVLKAALHLLQAALAILIVVLVVWRMMRVSKGTGIQLNVQCWLDGTGKTGPLYGTTFCVFAICVALVSLIASGILRCANSCLGCLTANACGIANFGEMIIDIILFTWWAVAFALFLNRGVPANNKGWEREHPRNIIIAAAAGEAVSFALSVLLTCCGMGR